MSWKGPSIGAGRIALLSRMDDPIAVQDVDQASLQKQCGAWTAACVGRNKSRSSYPTSARNTVGRIAESLKTYVAALYTRRLGFPEPITPGESDEFT
jgi:hypothetical protein